MTDVDAAKPTREPTQGRSRASFERMLAAAEKLLVKTGSDNFTLADVSKSGKVSIGSIYCRFDSKDDLIRAVQVRALAKLDAEQAALVESARREASSLDGLVTKLIEAIAESLRQHGPVMRPLMQRATFDTVIATVGKRSYAEIEKLFREAILERRAEINHPDPERAVQSIFRIAFAAIARYLGFGSATMAAWEGDWQVLKEDLAAMSSAFLHSRKK
jgi:AcrR family transcriptional regulator